MGQTKINVVHKLRVYIPYGYFYILIYIVCSSGSYPIHVHVLQMQLDPMIDDETYQRIESMLL